MRIVLVPLVALLFCSASMQNARAEADLGLKRIGVDAGLVSPEDIDATFGIGAFADLGTMAPNFRLSTHLNYWSQSEESFGAEATIRDISLGARGTYLFPVTSPKFQPHAGIGLGMHFMHAEVELDPVFFPGMTVEDSSTELGFELGGGFIAPMSPTMDFTGDVWYGIVDSFSHLSMKVGLAFRM